MSLVHVYVFFYFHSSVWSYAKDADSCLTYEQVLDALSNVTNHYNSWYYSDYNTIIKHAHQKFNITSKQSTNSNSDLNEKDKIKASTNRTRGKMILATTDMFSYYLPSPQIYKQAKELKDNDVFILSIMTEKLKPHNYRALVNVTTPGQVYNILESNFDDRFYKALTYANCRCPADSLQFTAFNAKTGHIDYYADCFQTVLEKPRISFFAERECERRNGSLAALTSPTKFSFIKEHVKPIVSSFSRQDFHIGLYRVKNESLLWYYYQRHTYKLGKRHNALMISRTHSTSRSECGFVRRQNGIWHSAGMAECSRKLPFICQLKAHS